MVTVVQFNLDPTLMEAKEFYFRHTRPSNLEWDQSINLYNCRMNERNKVIQDPSENRVNEQ